MIFALKFYTLTIRWLHHFDKFLEPSDEWAGRECCCFLLRWRSWVFLADQEWAPETCRAKFEFFSFNTYGVSRIFWQRVVQPRPKYSYCILLKGFCWVSVCWILNYALCSMSWVFSVFLFCDPLCHQYLTLYQRYWKIITHAFANGNDLFTWKWLYFTVTAIWRSLRISC